MAGAAIGTAAIGAGTAAYGANKQSKAQKASDASNREAVAQSDQSAWVNYLLTRGLQVDPNTPTGSIPTNARASNTHLPLWANMTFNPRPAKPTAGGMATPPSLVRRRQPHMVA